QHGVHRFIAGHVEAGDRAYSTIEEFKSLPEILSENNYTCGLGGKWHLGDYFNPQEGFSHWITKRSGHTPSFYNDVVIENGKTRVEPSHLTPFWTKNAIEFIEKNKKKPFFLFLAYNGPYSLGTAILPEPKNRHAEYYADKPMESFPRAKMHPWMHSRWQKPHLNNITSMRNTASQISLVDDGVGEVMAKLKELGLDDNTLVIFTADQGFAGGHGGFWGMGDHTRPLTAREQCMHIPLIVRQPGKVEAGKKLDEDVANYDLYPSLLNYLGLADQIPAAPARPGRDFSPLLQGKKVTWDNTVFYEFENIRVIRSDGWKYVERIGGEPNELYDLANDPGEANNLAGDAASNQKLSELRARLHTFFEKYSDPKWDLWSGKGSAKGGLLLGMEPYKEAAKE
ncbi:MAG: sulfatase-like hydrolase/transferase, partial [Planctomycetales bacterium]